MSRISISRAHDLTRTRAVKVANRVAQEVAPEYGVVVTWNGDVAHLRGPGVSGSLKLAPNHLHFELELGLVATLFRDQIATAIEAELDTLLEGEAKIRRTAGSEAAKRDRLSKKPAAKKLRKAGRDQR